MLDEICDDSRSHEDNTRFKVDTDDGSETEFRVCNNSAINGNNHELKEQMYQLKLDNLKKQLQELRQHNHPEYLKRVRKIENQYNERLRLNEIHTDYQKECVERDYILEKNAAQKEYEEKKIDLKDNILTDFEERKKVIENERYSLELTSDSMEIKPTITRKLRRRPNEPVPVVEKRRKPTTGQLTYLLDEKEIDVDLKLIQRNYPQNGISPYSNQHNQHSAMLSDNANNTFVDTKIEDGKLLYERRWFLRGQNVFVEYRDLQKFPATITMIGNDSIWVKKLNDSKVKINLVSLAKGKVSIKRRAA